jgi:5-methylcytosine-specific restriction protein A
MFRGKGPNGRNLCHCGCGREVAPPRRSAFSEECVTWHNDRSNPARIRSQVEKRDKGVCALCGLDTTIEQTIARETTALWQWLARRGAEALCNETPGMTWSDAYQEGQRWIDEQREARGWNFEHWWEADHIIPVIEGGGGCDFTGYRTLCIPCHHRETAALAARRAVRRKEALTKGQSTTGVDTKLTMWTTGPRHPRRGQQTSQLDPECAGRKLDF